MKKLLLSLLLVITPIFIQAADAGLEKAVTFTLTNTESTKIKVTETAEGLQFDGCKNKVVFLVLFGHQCPPCNLEIPEFIKLQEKYKDNLAIFAIEAQQYSQEALKKFKTDKGINYNLIAGSENEDFISYVAGRARWNGAIPFLIVIDKNAQVQEVKAGFVPQAELEELIKTLNK
ncbi:MAG: hypothetical protein KU29_00560 [Sulfurovum sp. FS06-10]|nr:MAG: hypothetical protein KU29_00560 [Sulfurovum sp. FS06-10]